MYITLLIDFSARDSHVERQSPSSRTLDDNIIRTRGPEHVRSLAARTLPDLRATSGGDTVESQKRSNLEQLSTATYTYGSESVDAPTVNQNLFQQAHNSRSAAAKNESSEPRVTPAKKYKSYVDYIHALSKEYLEFRGL
jgi:hypothetical protein